LRWRKRPCRLNNREGAQTLNFGLGNIGSLRFLFCPLRFLLCSLRFLFCPLRFLLC
jgi:hypothetical protein